MIPLFLEDLPHDTLTPYGPFTVHTQDAIRETTEWVNLIRLFAGETPIDPDKPVDPDPPLPPDPGPGDDNDDDDEEEKPPVVPVEPEKPTPPSDDDDEEEEKPPVVPVEPEKPIVPDTPTETETPTSPVFPTYPTYDNIPQWQPTIDLSGIGQASTTLEAYLQEAYSNLWEALMAIPAATTQTGSVMAIPAGNFIKFFKSAISITVKLTKTDDSGAVTVDARNWYFKTLQTEWNNSTDASTLLTLEAVNLTDASIKDTMEFAIARNSNFYFDTATGELYFTIAKEEDDGTGVKQNFTYKGVLTIYDEIELSLAYLDSRGIISLEQATSALS